MSETFEAAYLHLLLVIANQLQACDLDLSFMLLVFEADQLYAVPKYYYNYE